MLTPRRAYALALLVAAASAALLAAWVARFSVNIPWWDEWILSETIVLYEHGDLSLAHLLSQHNESRKFFPRLIMLLNASWFDWNLRLEMALSVVLASATFANLVLLLRRTSLSRGQQAPLVALAGLLVFSPIQGHNFLMGVQYIMFTVTFALTANLLIATGGLGAAARYATTAGLALLATFSFSNGMVVWVATFPVLATARGWRRPGRFDALWLLAMLATLVVYFADYERPAHHPLLSQALAQPAASLWFYLLFLGSSLGRASFLPTELACGVLGIGLALAAISILAGITRRVARRGADALLPFLPWLALALYGFGSGLMTTLGRAPFGSDVALANRYVTVSIHAVFAVAVLGCLLANARSAEAGVRAGRPHRVASRGFVALVGLAVVLGIAPGYRHMREIHDMRQNSFDAFASGQLTREAVATLFPEHMSDYLFTRFAELSEIGCLAEPLRHGEVLHFDGAASE